MIEFVLAAALLLRDPPGDAVGAGSLVPPSAEQYRNVGSFDLLEVQVLESSMLAFTIEMGALPNPAGLANGFSNAVIDLYVDQGEGGAEALLPGPDMRMPAGRGWEVAVRITGDGATAYRSVDDATSGGPSVSYPVRVQADGRVIRVETPFDRGEIDGVFALTGVYDPFVASGWRQLSTTPSPWAFASETQRRPVIDLLAPDEVVQADAIRSGVLPTPRNRTAGAMWMLLMALGVLVAGVGLVLRRMVVPPVRVPAPAGGRAEKPPERPQKAPASSEPQHAPATTEATPKPTPKPTVALPTFLPALPPAAPTRTHPRKDEASGDAPSAASPELDASERIRRTFDAIGRPDTWLHATEDGGDIAWGDAVDEDDPDARHDREDTHGDDAVSDVPVAPERTETRQAQTDTPDAEPSSERRDASG